MKSHTDYFTFNTKKKRELIHLTPKLEFDGQHDKRLIVKVLGE